MQTFRKLPVKAPRAAAVRYQYSGTIVAFTNSPLTVNTYGKELNKYLH
jgi:hypothetical protein